MPREKMAGVEGVEPSHTAPETAVLPLDDTPTELSRHTARKRRAQVSMLRKQAPPVKPQFWELRKMRGAAEDPQDSRRRKGAVADGQPSERRPAASRLRRAPIARIGSSQGANALDDDLDAMGEGLVGVGGGDDAPPRELIVARAIRTAPSFNCSRA